ncbi:MAG: sigma-70 family RNA polymerase sigma factor [Candidatus Eremiobacteraeota bacterium]|nr:sigma-70 family RNA polymerase sigma factor [Candidatus Eremiobacteraeota bacterium]
MIISTTDYLGNDQKVAVEQRLAEAIASLRSRLTDRAQAIVHNRSDAEDAVQEAAVRAWQARERLRPGSDLAPWLNTILTRVAIDLARSRRYAEKSGADSIALDDTPEHDVLRGEVLRSINSAAQRLSPSSRRVFFLHDVEGFTSQEIAALDDVPYHTVRTRLRRARTSLRNELREAV